MSPTYRDPICKTIYRGDLNRSPIYSTPIYSGAIYSSPMYGPYISEALYKGPLWSIFGDILPALVARLAMRLRR